MPGPLIVNDSVVIPDAELIWRFSRSSGPGGQGVNTTDSRVELTFDVAATTALPDELKARALSRLPGPTITIAASEYRSQLRNREAALQRLAQRLREAIVPPPKHRRATKPTRGSVERRIATKKQRSDLKRLRRSP
ncbi:alternative ribosome rescue aminoacyl-tRNA hydrolase ArfB [Nonomuraea sediminis]|uniref:alternative ribosome rescue aminoacyl-tRNA hydrolase ArfB n=1 Tax=Nonomuraea sediminis TaxID=2835864 RepID=UPI001BDDB4B1|nr:alternative ribosome rescue aminoacyl-tRNA hydrolase ArfB [Nonomuraea sediminis]